MSNNFNMSFDPVVKQQFAEIVEGYGLTVPQAFKLFANQVIKTKTIPLSFDWQAEHQVMVNEKILSILAQNQQEHMQGTSIKYANFDEMMADLTDD